VLGQKIISLLVWPSQNIQIEVVVFAASAPFVLIETHNFGVKRK
jgi:hypothetical protein